MNLDLTPLFRTSVGYDRMAQMMNQANRNDQQNARLDICRNARGWRHGTAHSTSQVQCEVSQSAH